jgi:hypothetical protein
MTTTNHRTRTLLGLFVLGCGLVACTTQEAKTDASSGTGGKIGTGTGGSSGGGLGGSGGSYAVNDGVLCPLPTQALISDFGYMTGDGGTDALVATDTVHFGAGTAFSGGEFYYPTDGTWPLTSDVTASNWHMSGTLGTYSGFGLFFDNCTHLDASAYKGISFTISGSVPMGSMITMGIGTLDNVIAASWLIAHPVAGTTPPVATAAGRCIPASGTNQYDQPTCGDATKTIPVTATPTTQTILWTDFIGGKPDLNGVHPSDIISVYWFFPPPVGAGGTAPTTYPADLVIDDLSFVQ